MANEIKVGILAIAAIIIFILGFKFLSGSNVLSDVTVVQAEYQNVALLSKSTPVIKNGFQIGVVRDIELKENNPGIIVVTFEIDGDIKFPKSAIFEITPNGMMGDKVVNLLYDSICTADCANDGDILPGSTKSLISSMIGEPDDIKKYASVMKNELGQTWNQIDKELSNPQSENALAQTIMKLQQVAHNLSIMTIQMNKTLAQTAPGLAGTMNNFEKISANINANNQAITQLINNAATLTEQMKGGDLQKTLDNTNSTLSKSGETMDELKKTLKGTQESLAKMNGLLGNVEQGEGNIGKLATDEKLYDNVTELSKNLSLLMQDLRLNPKRYINVSVFGKKQIDFTLPKDDPAYQQMDK